MQFAADGARGRPAPRREVQPATDVGATAVAWRRSSPASRAAARAGRVGAGRFGRADAGRPRRSSRYRASSMTCRPGMRASRRRSAGAVPDIAAGCRAGAARPVGRRHCGSAAGRRGVDRDRSGRPRAATPASECAERFAGNRWPGKGPFRRRRRRHGWRPPARRPAAAAPACALPLPQQPWPVRPLASEGRWPGKAVPGHRAPDLHSSRRRSRRTWRASAGLSSSVADDPAASVVGDVAGRAGRRAARCRKQAGRRGSSRQARAAGKAAPIARPARRSGASGAPAGPESRRRRHPGGDRSACRAARTGQQVRRTAPRPGRPLRSGGSPGSGRGAGRRSRSARSGHPAQGLHVGDAASRGLAFDTASRR